MPRSMSLVFPHTFVPWFRAVAPYNHAYRGKTFGVLSKERCTGDEAVHSATLVEELTRDLRHEWAERDKVTYHDPCYLGRYADTHQEPRALLTRFGADVSDLVPAEVAERLAGRVQRR